MPGVLTDLTVNAGLVTSYGGVQKGTNTTKAFGVDSGGTLGFYALGAIGSPYFITSSALTSGLVNGLYFTTDLHELWVVYSGNAYKIGPTTGSTVATTLSPSHLSLTFAVKQPSLSTGLYVGTPPAALILAIVAPSVVISAAPTQTATNLTLAIKQPAISSGRNAPAAVGLTLAVRAPTLSFSAATIAPTHVSLTFTAYPPAVTFGTPTTAVNLTLAVRSPTVHVNEAYGGIFHEPPTYQKPLPGTQLQYLKPLNRNLVAHWLLNEGAGIKAKNANRQLTTTSDGTLTGGVSWSAGRCSNSALLFNGSTGYLSCGSGYALFQSSDTFSLSCWFRTRSTTQSVLMAKFDEGTAPGWNLELTYTGQPRFGVFKTDGTDYNGLTTSHDLRDGAWHHLLGVYNGSGFNSANFTLYVDGVPSVGASAASVISGSLGDATFCLGRRINASATFFAGSIDHAAIWNIALRPDQAQQLYLEPFSYFTRSRFSSSASSFFQHSLDFSFARNSGYLAAVI